MDKTTHFGYKQVAESEKAAKVAEVFHSVAAQYDLMNDLMSAGLHRLWKRFAVEQAGLRPGMRVLDVAGGTADLTRLFLKEVGETGTVLLTDINFSMLREGRDRMLNEGRTPPAVQCDGERLPFPDNYFDCVSVAFGLRNMTHKDQALAEMHRVLKPGGRLLVDNINLLGEEGWAMFLSHCAIPPHERPAQISKTSTPQELHMFFSQAGFVDIVQKAGSMWVVTYATKPRAA